MYHPKIHNQARFALILITIFLFQFFGDPPQAQPGTSSRPHAVPDLSLQQKGEFLISARQYDRAVQTFEELIEKEPENGYGFRGLVRAYQGQKDLNKAELHLNDYLKENSGSASGWYGLGYVYYLSKNVDEAESAFKKSLEVNPQHALVLNNLGALLADRMDFEEAVKNVKQAISADSAEIMFYKNLQIIYQKMGSHDKFGEEYRGYLGRGNRKIARGYGMVLAHDLRQSGFKKYASGEVDETIKLFAQMIEIYKDIEHISGEVAGFFSLGLLYEELGNRQLAEQYFREVLQINPNHIQAREKIKSAGPPGK